MKKARKQSPFFSPAMISVYILFALLLIVYFGLAIYFNSHYLPNTTIGVTDCGWKTVKYVEDKQSQLVKKYTLTITDRTGKTFALKGLGFSYSYAKQGEEEKILKSQNAFTWPIAFFKTYEYVLDTSVQYNEDEAKRRIRELEFFQTDYIQAPADAYIQMNKTSYELIPEVTGTTFMEDKVFTAIFDAIQKQETSLVLTDDLYVNPTRYADSKEIADAINTLDRYLASTITYTIEGYDEDLSSEEIFAMLTLHEDFSVTLDTTKVDKFVQSLATKYNTYGDKRQFTTSFGDVITIGGGDYGWVINKKKEAAQILADLEGGTAVTREPIYEQTAKEPGPNDIGNTYIEVDYTNQHLWVYIEGEMILESDFVSGDMSEKNGSPDGVFKIVYKQRNATLRGEDYESSVSYFMPFAYNVGFHDATWRKKFGGQIYKTNGSHGCINLPPAFAETLYKTIDVGMPVVAYYREPVVLVTEGAKISNAYSYKNPNK